MIIRPATAADVPRLVVLLQEAIAYQKQVTPFYDVSPKFDWRRFAEAKLTDSNERVFVAERDAIVLGYIDVRALASGPSRLSRMKSWLRRQMPLSFVRTRRVGRIEDCYVESRFRRQRVGDALVSEALGWLRSQGATAIELTVSTANAGGRAFWEKHGFSPYRMLMSKPID